MQCYLGLLELTLQKTITCTIQTMFSLISPQSSQCFPNTTWQQEQKITGAMLAQRAQIRLGILSQENQLFQICLVLCFLTMFNITKQSWLFC